MWRKMFSWTTTASSITMPMASTRASIVMLLSVNPSASMQANVAMIDAGIAEVAIRVVRQSLMNPRIVSETRPAARSRWNWTSSMLRLMKTDWSRTVCTRMSAGQGLGDRRRAAP